MSFTSDLDELSSLLDSIRRDSRLIDQIDSISRRVISVLSSGSTVFTAGNGGSASSASHFTAELVGRFRTQRKPLSSFCLSESPSVITSIANDFSYDLVFSRQLEASANTFDILVLFSTSGRSSNIVSVIQKAQNLGLQTILLTGLGCPLKEDNQLTILKVPSRSTPRIQEVHDFMIHSVCTHVDHYFSN